MLADMTIIDWLGVLGSLVIAGAYLFVSRGWVQSEGLRFNLANLIGATLILLSLYYRPNAGAILIEVLWIAIAVLAILRSFRRRG